MAAKGRMVLLVLVVLAGVLHGQEVQERETLGDYVILGWNDLGMHCMNGEFSQLAILPPFNNLWVQVVRRGDPPALVSSGVQLEYRFPGNTTSANKVNFWDYEDALFGVNLAPNVGLTGNGLSGNLQWNGTAWEATGIPITPFTDAAPTVEDPYQLAEVTLRMTPGGAVLDQTRVVVPVSTEIHCDTCHNGKAGKAGTESRAAWLEQVDAMVADGTYLAPKTTVVDPVLAAQDILESHDEVDSRSLMESRPVLCASCHASNALGTAGRPGLKNLSRAIHGKHGERYPNLDCYACHPGNQTQCQRGAMYQAGKTCVDCHGTLPQVASSIRQGREPWLDEPTCGSCHQGYEENADTLYRNSRGHGGMYCAACHGSPHAITPTVEPRDNLQAIRVQGVAESISDCLVCHTVQPLAAGPHGKLAPHRSFWLTY